MNKIEFQEQVSKVLSQCWAKLKSTDLLKIWYHALAPYSANDVVDVIMEIYAERPVHPPSISYVKHKLRQRKAQMLDLKPVNHLEPYLQILRQRFAGKTDEELIRIQTQFDRVQRYKAFVGVDYKLDRANKDALENEQQIKKTLSLLSDSLYTDIVNALHIPDQTLFWDWLIWRVIVNQPKIYPMYYNIADNQYHHIISDEIYTPKDTWHWKQIKAELFGNDKPFARELPLMLPKPDEASMFPPPPDDFDEDSIPF